MMICFHGGKQRGRMFPGHAPSFPWCFLNGCLKELMMGPTQAERCRACHAVINPTWETCAACQRPLTTPEITIGPAGMNAAPVYWERGDCSIVGPAQPEFLARVGNGPKASYWVIAVYNGLPVWINS